jgi:hypothetical protein
MINAWSLLYDEIYGDDEMSPCKTDHINEDIVITTVGSGNTASSGTNVFSVDTSNFDHVGLNTSESDDFITIAGGENTVYDFDDIQYDVSQFTVAEEPIATSVNLDHITPLDADLFASMDGVELPTPGIEKDCNRKYKEDESIKALQNYISTTYGGHYTSDNNNVQTLDLIESVGDAEAFCRSNAIKYLSRYDKKGQAKRDILKALHYSLLLYHFSGQLNETTTRGYETF